MIIDVCCPEGEQRRTTATEQKLSQHEKQNWSKRRRFTLEAIISSAREKLLSKLLHCIKVFGHSHLRLLCVAKAGFDSLLI